jgi:very-short-patch-repair endonuclease
VLEESQQRNPPQSPLVRGEATHVNQRGADVSLLVNRSEETPPRTQHEDTSLLIRSEETPPLTRGGGEGFRFLPYDKRLTALARENRKNPTPAESKVWFEILSRHQFAEYKFTRQKPIEHFIVDFYCAKLGWVIEIDGDSHAMQPSYDERRTVLLQQHGLSVIRYDNGEVLNNIAGVHDDLIRRLNYAV